MKKILYLLCCIAVVTGCRSTSNLEKSSTAAVPTTATSTSAAAAKAYVQRAASVQANKQFLTASAKVGITGFGKDLTVNGSLKMKRDDVVRLSLRFLGVEVGLLEFTPQDVLVVDRINKQYVRAAYSEVSFLKQAGLDFYSLQSLFWNELFVPGSRSALQDADRFKLSEENGQSILSLTDTPALAYYFYTSPSDATVRQLVVKGSKATDKGTFSWTYGNFTTFGARSFPSSMKMSVTGTGKDVGLDLSLSSIGSDDDWNTRTTVSAKYKRRTVAEVFKSLGGL